MKRDEFFNRLVAHYWTAKDFRGIRQEVGAEAFEEIYWPKEAALRFLYENQAECERIFSHRHLNKAVKK